MVLKHAGKHTSRWSAIGSIAAKTGCTAETLRRVLAIAPSTYHAHAARRVDPARQENVSRTGPIRHNRYPRAEEPGTTCVC